MLKDGAVTHEKLADDALAGAADQLLAATSRTVLGDASEGTFLKRACPTSADGVAEITEVRGNTYVWNQLVADHESYSGNRTIPFPVGAAMVKSHKYLIVADFLTDTPNSSINPCVYLYTRVNGANTPIGYLLSNTPPYKGRLGTVITSQYDAVSDGTVTRNDGSLWYWVNFDAENTYTVENIKVYDLTLIYGAGNEPSTVAEFEARWGSDYKPYSAPRLLDANIAGINDLAFPQKTLRGIGTAQDVMTKAGIERVIGEVDLGSLDWILSGTNSSGVYRIESSGIYQVAKKPTAGNVTPNIRCALYETKTADSTYLKNKGISLNTGGYIEVYDPDYNTADSAAAFKAAMSGVMLQYELATPTTEPFTEPIDLTYSVQEGGTEAWIVPDGSAPTSAAVTGEIAYPLSSDAIRDLPLACIAPIENGLASANYAVGDYLIRNGTLYKVTTAIAAGESIPASSISARTVWQMVQEATA